VAISQTTKISTITRHRILSPFAPTGTFFSASKSSNQNCTARQRHKIKQSAQRILHVVGDVLPTRTT
ncbi:uncharacterized protein METZ01_LOCUS471957, partial [marine metagenome]